MKAGLLCALLFLEYTDAWMSANLNRRALMSPTVMQAQKSGSFFNPVPEKSDDDGNDSKSSDSSAKGEGESNNNPSLSDDPVQANLDEILRKRKQPSLASQPSTINGKPTAGQGFGDVSEKTNKHKLKAKSNKPYVGIGPRTLDDPTKPYVGIGPRTLNDPTKPEYDDQGYTLYADEDTGKKSRVFEALVEYPCHFTLKIVGANEGMFVQEMVALVAESCKVSTMEVPHSTRTIGKWMSITVKAPVESAEMLYQLYEDVDRDPRVKFKF
eukprot:CAMPEP_0198140964 /NCGR_PEP_ID=MMETSP1443-20131203/4043_1 /TAXON_ID=186043 /ORGANISM="Entomoneis sp., Strain CCMP2396" /LENGTH=268 /DNA_ID=CAMNT_0043803553 /DNA_START=263 /DNA_END=1069 /DNA_ORIENTATION=+